MNEKIKELQTKIATLQKAIDSDATPEAQKVVMQEKLDDLELHMASLQAAEENGTEHKNELLQKLFKEWHPQAAFAFTEDGGYANVVTDQLNEPGTEITVTIEGESPIVDDTEANRLKGMVAKLNNKKETIEIAGQKIGVTFTSPQVTISGSEVKGFFTLKLSQTLKF